MRCAKHQACWAIIKRSEHLPEGGRDPGTILVDKTTPTKYKYRKREYLLSAIHLQ